MTFAAGTVPSCTGLQASRVALYLTWSTRGYSRGAVLSGPLAWGQPLLYRIAHGLKVVGGIHWGITSRSSSRNGRETAEPFQNQFRRSPSLHYILKGISAVLAGCLGDL